MIKHNEDIIVGISLTADELKKQIDFVKREFSKIGDLRIVNEGEKAKIVLKTTFGKWANLVCDDIYVDRESLYEHTIEYL